MKIINDSASSKKLLISLVLGVGFGFAALFALLLVFALILLKADLGDSAATVMSTVALLVSSCLCGFISAKKLGSRVMLIAPFAGFVFYLTVAIIGAAVTKETFGKLFLLRMILCIVTSALGAVIATAKKSNKNII